MPDETKVILIDQIESMIHEVRGHKVMLDSDLAALRLRHSIGPLNAIPSVFPATSCFN